MSTNGAAGVYVHLDCDCDDPDASPDCWQVCPCSDCADTRDLERQRQSDPEGMASL